MSDNNQNKIHFDDGMHNGGTACGIFVDGWHWTCDLLDISCSDCQGLKKHEINKARQEAREFRAYVLAEGA